TPGASNAFAIASRLGLSSEILRQAAEMMGEEQVELHEVIQRAERDQRDLAEERRLAARTRADLERAKAEYDRLLTDLKSRRKDMLGEAREEARRIVSRAKQRTEDLLNLLRQSVQEAREAKEAIEREAELVKQYAPPEIAEVVTVAREELSEISEEAAAATAEVGELESEPEPEPEPEPVGELWRGDTVMVRSVRQKGSVLEPPDASGSVQVQVGLLRLSVPVSDLTLVHEPRLTVIRARPDQIRVAAGPTPVELHLRGLRVDAAVYELERYLDRAALAHHEKVRIVHGKGTGAVRQAVHERLREHPLVKSFHLAEHGEGDAGVTIVELGAREAG
ncbi:MAG: Smr/MutS family protein, partial [Armatimonadetes bacterium]|nr:Smr/MutS family protein [Armatimonadota bacterium]